MENQVYIDKQTNIIFTPDADNVYYPRYKDFDIKTGNASIISKIPIFRELFEFVTFTRKRTNKQTGKSRPIPLFTYQWSCLIDILSALLDPSSQEFLMAIARQGGKSASVEVLLPFALTILPKYVEVDTERFSVVLGSYKDDAVGELYKKIKPFILTAIDYYNKRNTDQLVCKVNDPSLKLMDSKDLLEIDKVFPNGLQIPYSQVRNVSAGTTNDGYYANLMIIDESGLINKDLFKTSMANFTSATAGVAVYIGVPNADSSSLFYAKRNSVAVKTLIYDYPLVYQGKKMANPKEAEKYRRDYEQKVLDSGERSSFIRWNYYLDTEDATGKFMSKEILENNNILSNEIRLPQSGGDKYIVAGIDVSAVGDYKVMVVGETTQAEEFDYLSKKKVKTYHSNVCDIISFNKEGKKQSGEEFAKQSAELCVKYKIDCVCIDSSGAGGKFFTQMFRKYLKIFGAKVMILPFSYNQNKQYLFTALEDSIYSSKIHLLQEDESWESRKLIEEMTYMVKKHVPGSTYVKYEAPKGSGFTDDHVNALALFNICLKEIHDRSRDTKKMRVGDGSGETWRLRLRRYATATVDIEEDKEKAHITSIWLKPL